MDEIDQKCVIENNMQKKANLLVNFSPTFQRFNFSCSRKLLVLACGRGFALLRLGSQLSKNRTILGIVRLPQLCTSKSWIILGVLGVVRPCDIGLSSL